MPDLLRLDSITKAGPEAWGRVALTGSHGGVYAAALALKAGLRAAIFHDAGIGLDAAGIGGLDWLAQAGMAAAAVDHRSAPIGKADRMFATGLISTVNAPARALGLCPGMTVPEAAHRLGPAPLPTGPRPPAPQETRTILAPEGARRGLILVDSAALVVPGDAGQIVVTGSHGALFGSDPANALKGDAFLALFNDAGHPAGRTRLPVLEARGIAAATVAAASARIGDARSTWSDGRISAANARARALGAAEGQAAADLVAAALTA